MKPLLEARGLHKSFGKTSALRGVDATIAEGEIVAIMGPSGSGKSTLLHCLAGVLVPDAGTVRFAGRDIGALSEAERGRLRLTDFGFVFQFGQLLPELTAIDNVSVPLLLAHMPRRRAAGIAGEWLERLGVGDKADKRPTELSGGEAQRVAIARALAIGPSVLFADEPTGSLDLVSAEAVMGTMLEQVRDAGTTVVIVTHDPRTAAYANREIMVRDGRISMMMGYAA